MQLTLKAPIMNISRLLEAKKYLYPQKYVDPQAFS